MCYRGVFCSAKILDPFEMGDFGTVATSQDIENAIGLLDKRILEMRVSYLRRFKG